MILDTFPSLGMRPCLRLQMQKEFDHTNCLLLMRASKGRQIPEGIDAHEVKVYFIQCPMLNVVKIEIFDGWIEANRYVERLSSPPPVCYLDSFSVGSYELGDRVDMAGYAKNN